MPISYKTQLKQTTTVIPRHLRGKSAEEIVAYMRDHYEVDWEAMERGEDPAPRNKSTAMLVATREAFFDPHNWKLAFYAELPQDAEGRCALAWVQAAIIWYHGAQPINALYGTYSRGYACG